MDRIWFEEKSKPSLQPQETYKEYTPFHVNNAQKRYLAKQGNKISKRLKQQGTHGIRSNEQARKTWMYYRGKKFVTNFFIEKPCSKLPKC